MPALLFQPKTPRFGENSAVIPADFIAQLLSRVDVVEVIDPVTAGRATDGQPGELVLTNLGRVGSPLVRYRTGDLVNASRAEDGRLLFRGGVLGRPLVVVAEDNQSKPGDSATVAKKLVSREKVVAILSGGTSSNCLEIAPLAQAARVPFVATTATNALRLTVGSF